MQGQSLGARVRIHVKFSLRQIKTYVAREWVQIITNTESAKRYVATPSNFNQKKNKLLLILLSMAHQLEQSCCGAGFQQSLYHP